MINYSQCWEDAELVIKALNITSKDSVISITSGGCNSLAIAACKVQELHAVDMNISQNYLLNLKLAAIKQLDYDDAIGFLGYTSCNRRLEIFREISKTLSENENIFWNSNIKSIKNGVVHCGKFEKYLSLFSRFILPLVHNNSTKIELTKEKDAESQITFYNNKWNTTRWRLLFKIFFSQYIMSGRGRSEEMFSQNCKQSVGTQYFKRTEEAFKHGKLNDNFYLSYILFGKKNILLPYYLKRDIFEQIKSTNNINIHNSNILDFLKSLPSNSIDKFNLSDIFEPLNIALTNNIFHEIFRTASPGARLIFWNNLVPREVPKTLKDSFIKEQNLEDELRKNDRIFFYDKFTIYTITK